jgi:predicted ATPase
MAQHPFLKSIRPVNLLSFGPDTEEIELRPLNVLIGANGSGKSNFLEIFGLLSKLPDKEPWSGVVETGGAPEWIWKGKKKGGNEPSITITTNHGQFSIASMFTDPVQATERSLFYSITLRESQARFLVERERFLEFEDGEDPTLANMEAFERDSSSRVNPTTNWPNEFSEGMNLHPGRSVLSMLGNNPGLQTRWPRMRELSDEFELFSSYRDWAFGKRSEVRQLRGVGLDSYRLASDSSNTAQVLKALRDRGSPVAFERLLELMRSFYPPVKDIDVELVGTHLRIMIKEDGLDSRTPAERLSDGTLRWLMLLIVLLDPSPPPLICIDEPELGLHPDMISKLADLLREASTRTQLVITTHSTALVDAFSDDPEAICVCEKIDGATRVRRLTAEKLAVWREDYSLGSLWASGEIGGNRW